MMATFLIIVQGRRRDGHFDPFALFDRKYWSENGSPFVVAFKNLLDNHFKTSCSTIQVPTIACRVPYFGTQKYIIEIIVSSRNVLCVQDVASVYEITADLHLLFSLFLDGSSWLEELRERLLVLSSAMVRACHTRDMFWGDLCVFFQRLFSSSDISKTERDMDSINNFIQVFQ